MDMQFWIQALGPVVLAFVGAIAAYLAGKRKNLAEIEKLKAEKNASDAQAASVIAQAAAEIVGPLLERMRELQTEVTSLRQSNKQLNTRVQELEDLLREFLPKGST